jgi:predicted enzyme related to lactoylglutathione lyase
MAVHADPSGAVFGVWQAGRHTGAELVDEEGTTAWLELTAGDPAAAAPFYRSVFGWDTDVSDGYVMFTLGGTAVAGCTDPSQGTTGWLPYFAVADPGAKAEQAQALGAALVLPLTHFDGGSCSILRDPQGAVFGLLHSSS